MSEDIFAGSEPTGILWVEVRDAAKCLRTALPQETIDPKESGAQICHLQ